VGSADPVIAVVDDESSVRTMLGRLLRLADYRVSVFASGEEFLASLSVAQPACVILDIHMPGLSGLDVHSQLRAAHTPIPIVFITASDDAALDRAAVGANVVRLLRKPFSSDALLEAVGDALQSGARGDLTKD
jgi:FixJ family two-component response regulator